VKLLLGKAAASDRTPLSWAAVMNWEPPHTFINQLVAGDLVIEYVVFYFGSTAPRIGIRGSPSRDIEEKSKNHPDSSGSEFQISNFAFAMIDTQLFSPTG
jgi:hypothetical protein